jgi:hypothetical protein
MRQRLQAGYDPGYLRQLFDFLVHTIAALEAPARSDSTKQARAWHAPPSQRCTQAWNGPHAHSEKNHVSGFLKIYDGVHGALPALPSCMLSPAWPHTRVPLGCAGSGLQRCLKTACTGAQGYAEVVKSFAGAEGAPGAGKVVPASPKRRVRVSLETKRSTEVCPALHPPSCLCRYAGTALCTLALPDVHSLVWQPAWVVDAQAGAWRLFATGHCLHAWCCSPNTRCCMPACARRCPCR